MVMSKLFLIIVSLTRVIIMFMKKFCKTAFHHHHHHLFFLILPVVLFRLNKWWAPSLRLQVSGCSTALLSLPLPLTLHCIAFITKSSANTFSLNKLPPICPPLIYVMNFSCLMTYIWSHSVPCFGQSECPLVDSAGYSQLALHFDEGLEINYWSFLLKSELLVTAMDK